MAVITNGKLIQDFSQRMGIQESINPVPAGSANFVQPVASVDKGYCDIVRHTTTSSSGASSATIYTTPTDKDFYLVGFSHGFIKDATCDVADGEFSYTVVVNGNTIRLNQFCLLTTTAQNGSVVCVLPTPIKVDRNTAVQHTGVTFTAGKFRRGSSVYGYLI